MRFMGGIFSDSDNDLVRNVVEKLQAGYDFENKLEELSLEEKYLYIGMCTGINTVVTMAESRLQEKSPDVLNEIFGTDMFIWSNGEDDDLLSALENGEISQEDFEEIVSETIVQNVVNDMESSEK